MADPAPPTASSAPAASTASASSAAGAAPKASPQNPALRMLGLPALPKKLPSRNWMIFWTISGAITAGIIYDRREKRKNIAKWRHAVEHLAKEPLTEGYGLGQPRKLTIYLSSPPGDGLRTAQDHYTEYVKPVLAASGLDWEFVQGRREGDVRAYTAERIRRIRREKEGVSEEEPAQKQPTKEEIMQSFRESRGIKEYEGVRGDIVIGRHTWKEYLRGLHEGWLGPLTLPKAPEPEPAAPAVAAESGSSEDGKPAEDQKPAAEEKKPEEEEKKPKRPPQPKPHNTTADYDTASLPAHIPNELNPAATIREPHLLGFLNTPTRMVRFFNRRSVADDIGREVAAVCLAHYREFRELPASDDATTDEAQPKYEQEKELAWEEKDWVKKIWKEDDPKDKEAAEITEKILAKPIVMDPRIAQRMRRFELTPEEEARISKIVVPEEEIEGWTKGTLRSLYRWGASKFEKKKQYPYVGDDVE